jgi:hypothetical protein
MKEAPAVSSRAMFWPQCEKPIQKSRRGRTYVRISGAETPFPDSLLGQIWHAMMCAAIFPRNPIMGMFPRYQEMP